MRRSVAVVVGATLVLVLVTAGLAAAAVAWWGHDGDDWGPGMMTRSSQDRSPVPGGRYGGGYGGMPGGMHGWGGMHGGMHGGGYGGMHAVVRNEHGYLVEMVAHHEEAIAAARELSRSDRAEMRALGRSIVAGQSAQVEQMRAWLARWYPDRPTTAHYRPMMRDLDARSGDDLDRTFLEDMVGHHMAAVMMSQQLLARGLAEHPQVAALARTISRDQHREILTMRRWLWEWFG